VLILSRRVDETIFIGDDIRVTILGIKGNQIRLGIDAPREVKVHREEVYQRILQEHPISFPPIPAVPPVPTVPPVPAAPEVPDFQTRSACSR